MAVAGKGRGVRVSLFVRRGQGSTLVEPIGLDTRADERGSMVIDTVTLITIFGESLFELRFSG